MVVMGHIHINDLVNGVKERFGSNRQPQEPRASLELISPDGFSEELPVYPTGAPIPHIPLKIVAHPGEIDSSGIGGRSEEVKHYQHSPIQKSYSH